MSVSESQLKDFVRFLEHPAYSHVQELISKRLYDKWLSATDDERKVIGDIHASAELYHKELKSILAKYGDIK